MSQQFHETAYRSLVRLYPQSFQLEFGEEMTALFCDRIKRRDDAHRSVVSIWIHELMSLPSSLINAYASERAGDVGVGDRPPTTFQSFLGVLLVIASVFFAMVMTTRNVANVGLFNEISLVILVAGLVFAGSLYGVSWASRSHGRRWHFAALATSMMFAALLASFWTDRGLQRMSDRGSVTYMRLPGVTAEFMHAADDASAEAFATQRRASKTPRFRVETTATAGETYIRVVRAGGVDWLYALLAFLIVASSAHVTSRRLRAV